MIQPQLFSVSNGGLTPWQHRLKEAKNRKQEALFLLVQILAKNSENKILFFWTSGPDIFEYMYDN